MPKSFREQILPTSSGSGKTYLTTKSELQARRIIFFSIFICAISLSRDGLLRHFMAKVLCDEFCCEF